MSHDSMIYAPATVREVQAVRADPDGSALVALIFGVFSLAVPGSIVAIAAGHAHRAAAKRRDLDPARIAQYGLVLGYLSLAVWVIVGIVVVIALTRTSAPVSPYYGP